jgi:hypothetical protein
MCDSSRSSIDICRQKSRRKLVAAGLVAAVIAVAGCGGDDDDSATTAPPTATDVTTTPTETTPTETAPTETPTEQTETAPAGTTETAPEEQPGGAGDEEPARTLALFTGRGGRITPAVVRVPAFISVQIELRSAEGAPYALRFGDVTVRAGGTIGSSSKTIDGLRPGEAITGVPQGAGNRVRISATAEPGP